MLIDAIRAEAAAGWKDFLVQLKLALGISLR